MSITWKCVRCHIDDTNGKDRQEGLMTGFEWNWGDLNWIAIVVAALSIMVVSPVWYMKRVFGQMWMDDIGKTEEELRAEAKPALYVVPIVTSIVSTIALALIIDNIGGGGLEGLLVGAVVGIGVAAMALLPHYTFAFQPVRLAAVNAGQTAVTLTLVGFILGAWG